MSATTRILDRDPALMMATYTEGRGEEQGRYHWFDPTDDDKIDFPEGVEAETGEFLYGLVRMLQPHHILETGTRIGISTRYMGLACQDNKRGLIVTIERDGYCAEHAQRKITQAGMEDIVKVCEVDARNFSMGSAPFLWDLLYLDSEPEYRWDELLRFWNHLRPGGMIVIHDLAILDDKAFHGPPDDVVQMLRYGKLRAMNFPTSSGLTILQKAYEKDYQQNIFR